MEVTKSFEYSGLLTKGATRTIENETKDMDSSVCY